MPKNNLDPNVKAHMKDIADMIEFIVNAAAQNIPPAQLDSLAQKAGYADSTFQKLFSRYVGLSPLKFRRYLDFQNASDFLLKGHSTIDAAYASGLSGNGRLHDLCVQIEAATPGQYAKRGTGLDIKYGRIPTPIGLLSVGLSQHGLCWAGFAINETDSTSQEKMFKFWKNASFTETSNDELIPLQNQINALWLSQTSPKNTGIPPHANPIKIYLEGTNFQIKVWQALLKIPSGSTVNYGAIGEYLGASKASRAVGSAVGANPISWLIPCHRVIKKNGVIHNYAWGTHRKKSILSVEGLHNS